MRQVGMKPRVGWFFLLMLLSAVGLEAAEDARLWVYATANFQVDASTDKLLALLKRARTAGYDGAVVTDYKFGKIDGRIDRYYRNLERTRLTAQKLGMELIPCVMPIGYSNSILQNNPNLAAGLPRAGLPVRGTGRSGQGGRWRQPAPGRRL